MKTLQDVLADKQAPELVRQSASSLINWLYYGLGDNEPEKLIEAGREVGKYLRRPKKQSEEHKANIAAAQKARHAERRAAGIQHYNKGGGQKGRLFTLLKEAGSKGMSKEALAQAMGVKPISLFIYIRELRKDHHSVESVFKDSKVVAYRLRKSPTPADRRKQDFSPADIARLHSMKKR